VALAALGSRQPTGQTPSAPVAAAQPGPVHSWPDMPSYDVDGLCASAMKAKVVKTTSHSVGSVEFEALRKDLTAICIRNEQKEYDELKVEWYRYSWEARRTCIEQGSDSRYYDKYFALAECVKDYDKSKAPVPGFKG
jgi:hypothetical protein